MIFSVVVGVMLVFFRISVKVVVLRLLVISVSLIKNVFVFVGVKFIGKIKVILGLIWFLKLVFFIMLNGVAILLKGFLVGNNNVLFLLLCRISCWELVVLISVLFRFRVLLLRICLVLILVIKFVSGIGRV